MPDIDNVLKKLRKYYQVPNNRQLANKLGIKYNTLSTWVQRNKIPYELLTEISQNENISLDWILNDNIYTQNEYINENENREFYSIDLLSIKASAGTGIQNYQAETIKKINLPKILFKTDINPQDLKIIEIEGDSMEPTIKDGSFVLIDTSKNSPVDGIYAILINDEILIKRLQFNIDGTIKIISDNKNYEAICYNPKEQEDIYFKILGKKILTIQ